MTRPSPFRVAILLHDPDIDTQYAARLAGQLRRDWFAAELWLWREPRGTPKQHLAVCRTVVHLSAAKSVVPLPRPVRLAWYLWRRRPDILYTVGPRPNPWARLVGAALGIPVVAGYRGLAPGRCERMLARFSPRILTTSAELKQTLVERLAIVPDRISVVPETEDADVLPGAHRGDPGQGVRADSIRDDHECPLAPKATPSEQVFLEVVQRGTTWTTTGDGRMPLEIALGSEVDGHDGFDERGRFRPDRKFSHVARPTVTAFFPPPDRASGAAVIICPGGGYAGVTIDREGFEVARRFADAGVAALALKYRLPRPDLAGSALPLPMQDLAGALRLVRAHAREWNVDPDRIGVMGFSAGGHMAAAIAQAEEAPAFAVLVYPVISMQPSLAHRGSVRHLLGRKPSPELVARYSLDRHVTARMPPVFLVHARDDKAVDVQNSILFAEALHRAGVPHEFLLYERGGHGFGLGGGAEMTSDWSSRCIAWLRDRRLLDRPAP